MPRKNKRQVDGTNSNSWVNPYERDTTRGSSESPFPSMHRDHPRVEFVPVDCKLCGATFMHVPRSSPKPIFCPAHQRMPAKLRQKFADRKFDK